MSVKLVIFDLDGVLVDSKKAWFAAWKSAFASLGMGFTRQDFEKNWSNGHESKSREIGLSEQQHKSLMESLRDKYLENHEKVRVFPGAVDMFSLLEEKGIKRALFTNNVMEVTEKVTKSLNLSFDTVVDTSKVKLKPDPEGFDFILSELGVDREHALFVGDTETDYQAGKNAGIKTLIVGKDIDSVSGIREHI